MRRPVIVGNWKMNKTSAEAGVLAGAIAGQGKGLDGLDIVIAPPFTALAAVSSAVKGSRIKLAGQNIFWERSGAYTGEISADMLTETGCSYVIIGHSERRQFFGETDETVNKKILAALAVGLIPIACVGETLEEREAGQAREIIEGQIVNGFKGFGMAEAARIIVAYEPIWAIGTGKTATSSEANEMHAYIRAILAGLFGAELAKGINILYGGSVKPSNSTELLSKEDIDGVLVGGASLDADSFISIAKSALNR